MRRIKTLAHSFWMFNAFYLLISEMIEVLLLYLYTSLKVISFGISEHRKYSYEFHWLFICDALFADH